LLDACDSTVKVSMRLRPGAVFIAPLAWVYQLKSQEHCR